MGGMTEAVDFDSAGVADWACPWLMGGTTEAVDFDSASVADDFCGCRAAFGNMTKRLAPAGRRTNAQPPQHRR